ncbi:MAG TPA: nucleoside-diphosphate kinase [Candidatus Paceibacterota bacterium]|nr:nucleoside-diphosphate kinase [Candidatus Paceibacterota bacterium]
MSQQLAYVLLTPYSLYKSRNGGILSRLISRTGLDLAAMRMFAPGAELVKEYAATIVSAHENQDRKIQELLRDYILENLSPDPKTGRRRRVMALVFRGDDAVRKVRSVVGNLSPDRRGGETIRDTYSDLIIDEHDGHVRYFEPAVMAAPNAQEAEVKLKLWARYSDSDGGLLENVIAYSPNETPERSLVLIKPDNFNFATGRPGNVIDFFSRTGLFIVGAKVLHMSTAQAMEFYGPVREFLRTKLKDGVSEKAKNILEKEFSFKIPPAEQKALGDILGPLQGDNQFDNIVRFMSGHAPGEIPESEWHKPGTQKCIALVYEGVGAVGKIRDVLGPTDPSKAPPGSIRREFGSTIMVNAAHASDSPDNAKREFGIVKPGENNFKQVIEETFAKI